MASLGSLTRPLSVQRSAFVQLQTCLSSTGASTIASSSSTPFSIAASSFHTSSILSESRKRQVARRKKAKVLAIRAERARENELDNFDFVLGDYKSASVGGSRGAARGGRPDRSAAQSGDGPVQSKWDNSLLKKVVLDRNDIWYSPPPAYPSDYAEALKTSGGSLAGEDGDATTTSAPPDAFPASVQPQHFAPALSSDADKEFILKHLPFATVLRSMAIASTTMQAQQMPAATASEEVNQLHKSEMVMRALDLRNADSRGIRVANTARIVEAFGRHGSAAGADGQSAQQGVDTGSTEVQAAILTHRIRQLSEHLSRNPRDVSNRKSLRGLVMKRAGLLKYYKRKEGKKDGGEQIYLGLLDKLGIDAKAVEGEITVR